VIEADQDNQRADSFREAEQCKEADEIVQQNASHYFAFVATIKAVACRALVLAT
jgi:hypothetical protein